MTKIEGQPNLVIGVSEVSAADDGGEVTDLVAVVSDGGTAETQEVVNEFYGEGYKLVEGGLIEVSHERRSRTGMGYTGRWNSPWDPKAPKQTDDGLVLQ